MQFKEVLSNNLTLKDRHKGKRCFVIGNGSSLSRLDLTKLQHEIVFVVNNFIKHAIISNYWQPNYYCIADSAHFKDEHIASSVLSSLQDRLNTTEFIFPLMSDGSINILDYVVDNKHLSKFKKFFCLYRSPWDDDYDLYNHKIDFTSAVPSVMNSIQLPMMSALYMGCTEIYLLGADHDWLANSSRAVNHFYGETLYQPTYLSALEHAVVNWKRYYGLAKTASMHNAKIYNATSGSFIDVFERVDYDALFDNNACFNIYNNTNHVELNSESLYLSNPDSIFTHLTQDEKHTLKNLAANINGKVFVELGSYLGASSYYVASGLANKPGAKLYCIDTWQNDAMSEGKRDTYCEFLCNIKPFSNFIVPIRDTTTNAALNFRQNIDFLFIDAGHDYEDVYNDVTHWLPKLNHGATVVFHDIGWAEGVKRVVNENIKPIAFNEGNLPNMYWAQIYTLNLSVIIPTRNRAALLYNTLDSLTRQTYPQHLFEIIVVDNGSTDNTPDVCQYFKRRLPNLTYLSDPRPGLHNGRHTGYEAAKGDILVYGDDDIEALPTWLEGIAESFADKSVGIVGGKNLPKFEVTPPAWVDDLKIAYKNGWWLGSYSILDFGDEVQEVRHELVWGCNFSIRKELLKQAGGFHPDSVPQELIKYRGDGETAVSAAVRNLGYRAVYNPKASVYHVVSATRLTPDYIYTRMFNQGVSDSYTSIRKTGGFTPARLYGPASGNIHEVVNRGLVDGFNWHQQMVQADPALLEWVLRDNYMGEKGTP